jgi:hypothetical protein
MEHIVTIYGVPSSNGVVLECVCGDKSAVLLGYKKKEIKALADNHEQHQTPLKSK